MFVIRREPSTRREIWISRSNALEICSDRIEGQVDACCQHQRLEAGQRVTRVYVDRRQRALVARVHRLEHVQGLGAAVSPTMIRSGRMRSAFRTSLADVDLVLPRCSCRALSVITCSCWS